MCNRHLVWLDISNEVIKMIVFNSFFFPEWPVSGRWHACTHTSNFFLYEVIDKARLKPELLPD